MTPTSRVTGLLIALLTLVGVVPPAGAYDAEAFRFSRGETAPARTLLGPGGARGIRIQVSVVPIPVAHAQWTPRWVGNGEGEPDLVATVIASPDGCSDPKIFFGKGVVSCDWDTECIDPLESLEMCFVTPLGPIEIVNAYFVDAGGGFVAPAIVTPLPTAPCGALDCSGATASITPLWPPNHALVPVTIDGIDGSGVEVTVTGVTSDEAVNTRGDGNTCPDASIVDGAAWVRMERSGNGNGRVYRVSFTATDASGATCEGAVTVCVPHDRGHGECVDDGQTVDATATCVGPRKTAEESKPVLAAGRAGDRATLDYTLPRAGLVTITLLDVAGRRVATLDQGERAAGTHRLTWETRGIPSGVYYYRVRTGDAEASRPVVIAR